MSENIYELDIGGSCSSERLKSYTLYTAQRSEMKEKENRTYSICGRVRTTAKYNETMPNAC